MFLKQKKLLEVLQKEFAEYANEERAQGQQRYMKSSMPFWGITLPEVKKICNKIFKNFVPQNNTEYRSIILYLFKNAHCREEWHAGMQYAGKFKSFIKKDNVDLYLKVIRIAQWWDIVDHVAVNLVGQAIKDNDDIKKYLEKWIVDENMWIRRTALLAQLKYKEETNSKLLESLVLQVSDEKEFFIRKAIGWALRQYSYSNPAWVKNFIKTHQDKLSTLSVREGLKTIQRLNL
ncbi:DNA alkylation repair protein [bacterium]|nr:DNA alkylation repair protein [bacterium]